MGRDYLFSVSKKGWDATKYRSYAILLFYIETLYRCLPQKPNIVCGGGGAIHVTANTSTPLTLIICNIYHIVDSENQSGLHE